MTDLKPTLSSERIRILDSIRGFALFGILFANLYSFIGYNTFTNEELFALNSSNKAVLFFIDWFIEGKFYSIFSILFGLGFALQAERFRTRNGSFTSYWFKRMIVLLCFGLIHMTCIWNGDILTLYSLLGLLLPFFLPLSNKILIRWILILLATPMFIHTLLYLTPDSSFWGLLSRISQNLKAAWGYGDLSLLEMRTSDNPNEVFAINVLSSIPRAMSYLMYGRYFKVLGLFLIGIVLARTWIPRIRNKDVILPNGILWIGLFGFVTSFFYAYIKFKYGMVSAFTKIGFLHGIIYHSGTALFALFISLMIVKYWVTGKSQVFFLNLAILGRMALSNYLFQNVTAVILFFGYGFALMREVSFASLPLFAFGILLIQWIFSRIWLNNFKQGPLEIIWKKLAYSS